MDLAAPCLNLNLAPKICAQLKQFGLSYPVSTSLSYNFVFRPPVTIGDSCTLSRSKVDYYSYIGENTTLRNTTVGRYSTLATYVFSGIEARSMGALSASLCLTARTPFAEFSGQIDRIDPEAKAIGDDCAPITIGHDVWIDDRVNIAGGVTIGTGAVIGAGSYITKDVPPYAVVVGRDDTQKSIIQRYRFSDEIISDLLELKWWDYDLPKLMSSKQNTSEPLPFDQVADFIAFMKDSDTSTWPRISAPWICLEAKDAQHAAINPVDEDFDQGHLYQTEQQSSSTSTASAASPQPE